MTKATDTIIFNGDPSDALRDIDKTEKELADLERQADRVRRTVGRADGGQRLRDRLRGRFRASTEGISLGPMRLGGTGFRLETGMLLGAVGRGALAGVAVGRAGGMILNRIADVRDMTREGVDVEEALLRAGRDQVRNVGMAVAETVGIKSLTTAIARLAFNIDEDDARKAFDRSIRELFTTQAERKEREDRLRAVRDNYLHAQTKTIEEQFANLATARPVGFQVRTQEQAAAFGKELQRINETVKQTMIDSAKSGAEFRRALARNAEGG